MNIKQSFRIIFRNKTYGILNTLGLAIGIAASALILLWVEYNMNSERSVPNRNNLYRLGQNQYYGDDIKTFFACSPGLFNAINDNLAGVERATRYTEQSSTFRSDDNGSDSFFEEDGAYADSTLFAMIDLPFVVGSPQVAFAAAHSMVISQRMAQKIFGNDNALGKVLRVGSQPYEITGVFKDREENGTFRFDWLMPYRILENEYIEKGWMGKASWGNWFNCYIELAPATDVNFVNQYLTKIFRERSGWDDRNEIFIYPLQRMHLYGEFKEGKPTGGGYIRTVRMFFAIGMAILLIACINFMNLNTARSQKRAKEVGVRKALGARFPTLVGQFMSESAIVTLLSLAIAVVLVLMVLPLFNQLISLKLAVDITNPYHSVGLLAVGVLCSLLSGLYPAFYLSSFSPLHTLKKLKNNLTGGAGNVRKILVVIQFTVSFVLICSTAIIYQQIRHLQNRPAGFEKQNLVLYQIPTEIKRNFTAVQEALVHTGVATHCGLSNQPLINIGSNGGGYNWQGKLPEVNPLVFYVSMSPGLIDAAGMRLAEGEDFSWQLFGEKQEIIINRSFADIMGDEGRVGGIIEREGQLRIIGIVEDFVFNDFTRGKAEPVIFSPNLDKTEMVFVRLNPNIRESEATATIEKTLQQFAPHTSFTPIYMEELFDRKISGQRFTGKLAGLFAVLAVFLSCMGLFGLSAFAAEQRTKEIGIRKVLGATIGKVIYLLGRSFMLLLLISFLIAIPAAWYAGKLYLQNFDYKIAIEWYVFAGAALLVFLIAMLTVSMQSLRAATANPVKSIKSE